MTIHSFGEIAEYDEDGQLTGFQFEGRERAIQEWREKKEEDEFRELVERLQKRNSARRTAASAEGRRRLQETDRRFKARHGARINAAARRRRQQAYEANPVVNQCEECGVVWSPPYEQRVRRSRFCSRRCRNRSHGRTRDRSLGLRDMDLRQRVLHVLRDGALTSLEIAEAVDGKLGSVRTCLSMWVSEGAIQSDGRKPARYSLPKEVS